MKALAMVICMLSLESSTTGQDALASVYDQFRRSDYEAAARDLQDLVVRYPASTELRALYVNQLSLREPERAQKLARELRHARPDDPWTWYAIASAGVLEPGTEHLAVGLEALDKMSALAKEPLPDAMLRLKVVALLRLGRIDEALAFLDEVEDRRSRLSGEAGQAGLPVLHALRAMAREAAGEEDEAGALYRRARAAAPDDVRIGTSYVYFLHGRDRAAAAELAKQLVEQAPLSLRAHEAWWHTIIESRELTAQQKESAISEDAEKLLAARDWPEVLQSVAARYRRIESPREEELHRRILERFPWTPEAENALARVTLYDKRLRGPEAVAKRRQAIHAFIEYPAHFGTQLGAAYAMLLQMDQRDPSVSDAELLRVVDGVRAYVKDPLGAKTIVAEALAARGLRLEEAERLAREGVRETPRMLELERHSYGDEYERSVDFLTARARAALAAVLLKRNKLADAGKELQAAAKLRPDDPEINLLLGHWHEQKKEFTAAELAYGRGLIYEGRNSTRNLDALRAMYTRRKKSEEGFDVYLANLRQAGTSDDKRRALATRLIPSKGVEQPLTLKDLSGKEVSLADVKGQIAVVNFWALWCVPCVAEMPDLHKLQQKYAADPKVRILTVNSDNDPAKVAKWMEKNGYTFPVLIDDGYARKARVKVFPTTWFLDAEGKIAFETMGGAANLFDEFSWRIEALKAVER